MRLIILFLSLFLINVGRTLAQIFPEKLPVSLIDMRTIAKGMPVDSRKYSLGKYEVVEQAIDRDEELLFLQLIHPDDKPKLGIRYVLCMDLKTEKVVYSCKIKDAERWLVAHKNFIMRELEGQSTIYSTSTGEKIWSLRNDFGAISPIFNVGVTLDGHALDMLTGKEKWYAPIDFTYGWGTYTLPDDGSLYIAANGLQYINLKTGRNWRYPVSVVLTDFTNRGKGQFLVGNVNRTPHTAPENVLRGMHSNIVVYNGNAYMAGRENIVAVDSLGELKWARSLSTLRCGKSVLWRGGDTLYLLNRGWADWLNSAQYAEGVFLAAFNLSTGEKYYHTAIDDRAMVYDDIIVDDLLYVRLSTGLAKLNLRSGELLKMLEIEKEDDRYKDFAKLASGRYHYLTGAPDSTGQLSKRYPGSVYLKTGDKLLRIDENMHIQNMIQQYYLNVEGRINDSITYNQIANKIFLYKDKLLFAELNIRPDFVHKNKIVYLSDNSIVFTDMPL